MMTWHDGEEKGNAWTRKDRVKAWVRNHPDVIIGVGTGVFVVASVAFIVKVDAKSRARALEAQNALVDALNDWAEIAKIEAPLYPVA